MSSSSFRQEFLEDKEEPLFNSWWDLNEKREEEPFRDSLIIPTGLSPQSERVYTKYVKGVLSYLMEGREPTPEISKVLKVYDLPSALEWFHQFCQENGIDENAFALASRLKRDVDWAIIKGEMAVPQK